MTVRNITSFSGANDTELLRAGAEWLRSTPDSTLVLEPRDYHICDEYSKKLQYDVMHGKYGVNPEPIMFHRDFPYSIGIDLGGAENATLDGSGARILIDGFMETVSIHHCKGVTVKNLTFDLERKAYSHGYVTAAEKTGEDLWADVYFPDQTMITGNMASERWYLWDRKYQRFLSFGDRGESKELIAPNTIRLHTFDLRQYIGCEFYVWHTYHYRPTILVWEAKDTVVENVRIHSNSGMGLVGHRSENILLRRYSVVPSPGEALSTNGDATHIVSCKGLVRFEDCIFEGQGDDMTNIQTYYHTILEAEGNVCTITMRAPTGTHSQKADHPDPGDEIFLCESKNLLPLDTFRVISAEEIGVWLYRITLDKPLPDFDYSTGRIYIANLTQQPSVEIVGCRMRDHQARGMVIKTRNVLVENCVFDSNTLTAIHICAEGGWHEGTHSENITIRGNRIIRRNDMGFSWIKDTGGVCIEIQSEDPTVPVHKNVTIENNMIICPDNAHAIYASNVKGLKIRNNRVTSALPGEEIVIKYCEDVVCEENRIGV